MQVTVGAPSRAQTIGSLFDANPKPYVLSSERGFLTITGRYKGVPVSVISIGMGSPNMDFFVRETRESVTGDMVIIRSHFNCGFLTIFSESWELGSDLVARSLMSRYHPLSYPKSPFRLVET